MSREMIKQRRNIGKRAVKSLFSGENTGEEVKVSHIFKYYARHNNYDTHSTYKLKMSDIIAKNNENVCHNTVFDGILKKNL